MTDTLQRPAPQNQESLTSGYKVKLLDLLRERAYKEGQFTLSSGRQSDYYFDGRMVQLCPEGAFLLGEVLYDELKDEQFEAIGGKAVGAVPLVTAFVISSFNHSREVEGFFVRDAAKTHGTQRKVEGKLEPGNRVVIVDDVCTSGESIRNAIQGAEEAGARVVLIVSVVDREEGGSQKLREEGYNYRAIFTRDQLRSGRRA